MNARLGSESGFSMIEALVTLIILSIVTLGTVAIFHESQTTYVTQVSQAEKNRELRSAMAQIMSYVRQAGSDPTDSIGAEPVEILSANQIRINSDITGSVASTTGNPKEATGDPDGALDSIYEQVTIRYDAANQRLLMDIGYGEQILAEDVVAVTFTFLDADGNTTATPADIHIVRVEMTGRSSTTGQTAGPVSVTSRSQAFIRSRASF